jgi:hypothetical protein
MGKHAKDKKMSVAEDSVEAFQHKVEGGRAQGKGNSGDLEVCFSTDEATK